MKLATGALLFPVEYCHRIRDREPHCTSLRRQVLSRVWLISYSSSDPQIRRANCRRRSLLEHPANYPIPAAAAAAVEPAANPTTPSKSGSEPAEFRPSFRADSAIPYTRAQMRMIDETTIPVAFGSDMTFRRDNAHAMHSCLRDCLPNVSRLDCMVLDLASDLPGRVGDRHGDAEIDKDRRIVAGR